MAASPHGIRTRVLSHIRDEIAHARKGGRGAIWMKMNALVDKEIIDALYEASQAGRGDRPRRCAGCAACGPAFRGSPSASASRA